MSGTCGSNQGTVEAKDSGADQGSTDSRRGGDGEGGGEEGGGVERIKLLRR